MHPAAVNSESHEQKSENPVEARRRGGEEKKWVQFVARNLEEKNREPANLLEDERWSGSAPP